jgi:uncharacterized protein YbaR (Trm112 family)
MGVRRFLTQWQSWEIRESELVLEVGCGGRPSPRSDVLCDKFFGDPRERGGQPLVVDRPFVVGDALNLPFRSKAFDFVISAHLVEHLEFPQTFFDELARVAGRGCLIGPSPLWEQIGGVPTHRWLLGVEDDYLVLRYKPRPLLNPEVSHFFHQVCDYADYHHLIDHYSDYFNITYLWESEIKYRIEGDPPTDTTGFVSSEVEHQEPAKSTMREALRRTAQSWLGRVVRARCSRGRKPPLEELLICPLCHGQVRLDDVKGLVECLASSHRFPIRRGVPFMLRELVLGE